MGSGHFEMVIGFVFFISFVFFLFMFLSPLSSIPLPNSALEGLYEDVSNNVSVPLSTVFVDANSTSPTPSCFWINLPDELFRFDINNVEGASRVTVLGGSDVESGLDSSGDLKINNNGVNDNFFRVAISPEFKDDAYYSCGTLVDFELGGVVELEVFSYSRLKALKNSYDTDYAVLKGQLRVAQVFDFAIVPENMPELEMLPKNGPPDTSDVLARDYVVKVL